MAEAVVGALSRSLSRRGRRGVFWGFLRQFLSSVSVALASASRAFFQVVEQIQVLNAVFGGECLDLLGAFARRVFGEAGLGDAEFFGKLLLGLSSRLGHGG